MTRLSAEYILNFGPHHPSTHGLLRLVLTVRGEEIIACEPKIGYLHRNVEKLVEHRKFLSIIPYLDRLDYLAPIIQEHAYVRAIEKLLNIKVPRRALIIRTIFDELTRISSHIMAIGCLTYDLGCLSLFLYSIEEREKIMDIFESTTGARMHLAYYIPGGVCDDVSRETLNAIKLFVNKLGFYMDATHKLALNNRIFKSRTKGIGTIPKGIGIANGLSGVNLRASGTPYDVRKSKPYGIYNELTFETITLSDGDCYARNMVRVLEIEQSIKIIKQCLQNIEPGEISSYNCFKQDIKLPPNSRIYSSTETPRGEFGIHMFIEEDQTKPYRLHFKSPSFATIQTLTTLLIGHTIPDIPAILGSLDFIMGCCDR